ncbi:hypothetical protein GCM10020255_050610 [Rhodococcus baikonurensis]
MLAYLNREVGDAVTPQTLRRFVDESPASIDWLRSHGVPFEASLCPYKTSYPSNKHYLYFSGSESAGGFRDIAKPAPRGHRAKGRGTSGKMLYGPLAKSAEAKGVQLLGQTRADRLIIEDGRVIGVEALTLRDAPAGVRRRHATLGSLSSKPGVYAPQLRTILDALIAKIEKKYAKRIRIQARGGVILSAGGFVSNREMMRTHAPAYKGGIPLGTSGDDGKGINLGIEAGERPTNSAMSPPGDSSSRPALFSVRFWWVNPESGSSTSPATAPHLVRRWRRRAAESVGCWQIPHSFVKRSRRSVTSRCGSSEYRPPA